jgi:hypothetical protein
MTDILGFGFFENSTLKTLIFNKNIDEDNLITINKIITAPQFSNIKNNSLIIENDNDMVIYYYVEPSYIYVLLTSRMIVKTNIYPCNENNLDKSCFFTDLSDFVNLYKIKNKSKITKLQNIWLNDFYKKYFDIFFNDKLKLVQKQVTTVTSVMTENIKLTLERQNLVENLKDKTADLHDTAGAFNSQSSDLKKKTCRSNMKKIIIIAIVIILIILIIITIIVAGLQN